MHTVFMQVLGPINGEWPWWYRAVRSSCRVIRPGVGVRCGAKCSNFVPLNAVHDSNDSISGEF